MRPAGMDGGVSRFADRKRPPPWVERGGRRQAREGVEGVAPSVREGSAILALLVLAAPGLLVVLALLLLAVLVVALAALLLLAILVIAHAALAAAVALLAGTLAALLLLATLAAALLLAALALLVLVAVLIVVSHDHASSLDLRCARPGVNGLAAERAGAGGRSS